MKLVGNLENQGKYSRCSLSVKSLIVFSSCRKINPADCVDMECDGMKKALFVDEDGCVVGGSGGTVIPQVVINSLDCGTSIILRSCV